MYVNGHCSKSPVLERSVTEYKTQYRHFVNGQSEYETWYSSGRRHHTGATGTIVGRDTISTSAAQVRSNERRQRGHGHSAVG